jgi:hypothetical protein
MSEENAQSERDREDADRRNAEAERLEATARRYVELSEEHLAAMRAGQVRHEREALRERMEVAAGLFDNPAELADLAMERPELMDQIDADREALEFTGTRIDGMGRQLTALFGDAWREGRREAEGEPSPSTDADDAGYGSAAAGEARDGHTELERGEREAGQRDLTEREISEVLNDPVEFYAHARRREIEIVESGGNPSDFHVLRDFQVAHAAEIIKRPDLLARLGERRPELIENVLADAGYEKGQEPGFTNDMTYMAHRYTALDTLIRDGAYDHDPIRAEEARTRRVAVAKDLENHPVAAIMAGQIAAAEGISISEKLVSDLQESRGYVPGVADPDRLDRFAATLERERPEMRMGAAIGYAAVRDEIANRERTGEGAKDLYLLRLMAEKKANLVRSNAASVRDLMEARPDLKNQFIRDADGKLTKTFERLRLETIEEATAAMRATAAASREAPVAPQLENPDDSSLAASDDEKDDTAEERGAGSAPKAVDTIGKEGDSQPADGDKSENGSKKGDGLQSNPEKGLSDRGESKPKVDGHPEAVQVQAAVTDGAKRGSRYSNILAIRAQKNIPDAIDVNWRNPSGGSIGDFVGSQCPNSQGKLERHLASPNAMVLALPLTRFSASKSINRALHQMDAERLKRLYQNTAKLAVALRKDREGQTRDGSAAHDSLEMGRRAMAEVLVRRKILSAEKVAAEGYMLISERAKGIPDSYKRDPYGYIQRGELTKRAAFLKSMGGRLKEANKKNVADLKAGAIAAGRVFAGATKKLMNELMD